MSSQDNDRTVFDPGYAMTRGEVDNDRTVIRPEAPANDAVVTPAAVAHDPTVTAPPAEPAADILSLTNWIPSAETRAEMDALDRAGTRGARALGSKPEADHVELPVGFKILEYRIDSVLGQGGFGIAYAATDVNLNTRVVIKEYLPEDFAYRTTDNSVCARADEDQDFYQSGLDSFLVEARTLATFRHPNIVRVARFFEANRTAYMVLEYERGQSLKSWRKAHDNVAEADLVALLAPLFNGLAEVHRAGYLHRDIKPDNIYVRDEDGSLVLLDFGSARQTANTKTESGAVVTPGYAALEQYAGGGRQGPWTDIYALGATLFWLVTGKKPYDAPTRFGEQDPLPSVEKFAAGKYSPEFLRAIDWALNLHPSDRPQSVDEFRNALFAGHAGALGLQAALKRASRDEAADASWAAAIRSPYALKRRISKAFKSLTRPGDWPIAVTMTVAMLFAALTPMVITAYFNHRGSVDRLSASELHNLELLATSTAGRISQLLVDSFRQAAFLTADPDLAVFLASPTPENQARVQGLLDALVKTNPDVQVATLLDADGKARVSTRPEVRGVNFKFRQYFQEGMKGKPFVTGILVGATAGEPGVFFANPVLDANGKALGVVTLRIHGNAFAAIMQGIEGGTTRTNMLIDADGVVIHHKNPANLYKSLAVLSPEKIEQIKKDQRFRRKEIESFGMTKVAAQVVGARSPGSVSYFSTISGKEEIAGYAPVNGHDWVVITSESREAFEEPLRELFHQVLVSVLLVGLLFIFLTMRFSRRIVRPVQQLTAAAHHLKSGDYDQATVRVTSSNELGQLARVFNVMIDVLRQRDRELNRKK